MAINASVATLRLHEDEGKSKISASTLLAAR
jgi:hypothetical protein